MKRQCNNCEHWIPYIDNGQCDLDSHYCEFDDYCKKHKLNYIDELLLKYGRNRCK